MPIAVRICPTKMSRDDYAKVMADLERTRGGTPEGRLFHAGYGEDEVHMFDVWDSRESFESYHQDLVGHLQAAVGRAAACPLEVRHDLRVVVAAHLGRADPDCDRQGRPPRE